MKLKGCFTLCLAVSSLVWSSSAGATTIALDFSSLPSAQGWTYLSDGAPETSIFSEELGKRMSAGIETMDPETLVKTWMPLGLQGFEQAQKTFWSQMGTAAGGAKKGGDR